MNELIMPHNAGVKRVLDSMKEVLTLYKNVTGNYRPLLDGERVTSGRFFCYTILAANYGSVFFLMGENEIIAERFGS